MSFTDAQKKALEADLLRSNVKTREQSGMKLSYVEGWHVIAEANRIFGFDGWSSETVETKCIHEGQRKVGQNDGWGVSYICRVAVRVLDGACVREGTGVGHGISRGLGDAHESAIKEAETDARKRALMTFGNQFGLALYDRAQENVEDDTRGPAPGPRPAVDRDTQTKPAPQPATASPSIPKVTPTEWCMTEIAFIRKADFNTLKAWERNNKKAMDKLKEGHPSLYEDVTDNLKARYDAIGTP